MIKSSKPIKKKSNKQAVLDAEYSTLRKEFLAQAHNSCCKARLPGCMMTKGLTIHHKKGRGLYLLDTDTWITLCLPCHKFVEEHPQLAKTLDWSTSRI